MATGDAGSTSLVLYAESVFEQAQMTLCTRTPRARVLVSQSTGQMVPMPCRCYACSVCGPRKVRGVGLVMSWAAAKAREDKGHARFVTLTMAPEDWDRLRQKMRNFRRALKARGYVWEWAWSVEVGKGGMKHVHAIQHGDYVPQRELQEVWGARTDIRGVTFGDGPASYMLKDAGRVSGYSVKGAEGDLEAHLALNGGRAAHWSRGFLHGLTRDQAMREATGWAGNDAGPWVMTTASGLR